MTSRPQMIFLAVLFAALLIVPLLFSRQFVDLGIQIMILTLFATSLNIPVGHLGNVSFGHAAFFAIGGYTCAYFQTRLGLPLVVSLAAALGLSALASAFIGAFCVRLNALYFAMLTLAFSMLVWAIAIKWRPVTGGDDGFIGVVVPEMIASPTRFFYFTLVLVAVCMALMWTLSASTMGRSMVMIRENETRASFLGVNVRRMRLIAFVIAGTFAGLAGAIQALYIHGMFPQSAFWTQSGQVLIMVLLGGKLAFVGPAIGAATLHLLETFISQNTEYWQFFLGTILLVIVLVVPDGLVAAARWIAGRVKGGRT